jgi:hypothetical protein
VVGFDQKKLGDAMPAQVPEPNLTALAELLSGQALLAMGYHPPGLKEPPPVEPQAARFFVDLLGVLKDRTEGNRTEPETKHLEDLLYQLRMKVLDLQATGPSSRSGSPGA